jgi:hypothetical protein
MVPVYEYKMFGVVVCNYVHLGSFYDDYNSGNRFTAVLTIPPNDTSSGVVTYIFHSVVAHKTQVGTIDYQTLIPLLWKKITETDMNIMNQQDLLIDASRTALLYFYDTLLPQAAEYYREHHASKVISRYWRCANSNPYNDICKRRLLREFDEMAK